MTARDHAIVLLLGSLDWFEPQPETSTGNIVRRFAKPGEGPSAKIPCPTCAGERQRRIRGVPVDCDQCLGKLGRPLGWIYVDANIEERFRRRIGSTEASAPPATRMVVCDSCGGQVRHGNGHRCAHCRSGEIELTESQWRAVRSNGHLSAEARDYGAGGDPVAAAIDRRDELGSYWELGLALGALRLELPCAYRTLVRVRVEQSVAFASLGQAGRLRHDVGLRYCERLMPSEIRVPPAVRVVERRRKAQERIERRRIRKESAA